MANSLFATQNKESNDKPQSSSSKKPEVQMQEKVDSHTKTILTVVERQKDLESSMDLMSEKLELQDHNNIKNFKSLFSDIKQIREELREIKNDINTIKEFNSRLAKQLRIVATKSEVQKLEKYIDFWNPIGFTTREELEQSRIKTIEEIKKIVENFVQE
jgi:hypothetical protein